MAKDAREQVHGYRQVCHGSDLVHARLFYRGANGEQGAANETLSLEAGLAAEAASAALDLTQDAGAGGEPHA